MSQNAKEKLLGTKKGMTRRTFAIGTVCAVLLAAGAFWFVRSGSQQTSYATQPLSKGNIQVTVTANGTLNPMRTVTIGSELSGIVSEVLVDVNSVVKAGDILIKLDDTKLKSSVNQAQATLSSAKAKLTEAKATVVEAQAKMRRYEELNKASGGKMPSRTELDEQRAVLLRAEASVQTALANIEDAKASLQTAQTDLSKASIKSPVDGVVLARSVEPGYAVAASLQAVELLTVATDLRQLELEVDVDEADVGQVKAGQSSYFTVAAYPNRQFPAELTKVAYGSSTTDNVVTYTTYLTVQNENLDLRPGMTATAVIETAKREKVLLIPNTALRFTPRTVAESSSLSSMMGPPRGNNTKTASEARSGQAQRDRTVYVLTAEGKAKALRIVTGLSDGKMTEVVSGDLKEGDKVITAQLKGRES